MKEILHRAYDHGRAILTAVSIAQDCPSLRSKYLEEAAAAARRVILWLDEAMVAARRENPPAPGPSLRCNACSDPQTCPQCVALNEMRDARFDALTKTRKNKEGAK